MKLQAKARLQAVTLVVASIPGKLSEAKLRDHFIKWLGSGAKGFSAAQHQGKLTINGEPVGYSGKGLSGGVALTKAVKTFIKVNGFSKTGSSTRPKYTKYTDAHQNVVYITSLASGNNLISFGN